MDLEEIKEALKSDSWQERYRVMACAEILTLDQIEGGLMDGNVRVRVAAARRVDFTPTEEQFERGLKDEYWQVRAEFVLRRDWLPTVSQVEMGLLDEHIMVRRCFENNKEDWEIKRQRLVLHQAFNQEESVQVKRKVL
jgi:hypothetical protein